MTHEIKQLYHIMFYQIKATKINITSWWIVIWQEHYHANKLCVQQNKVNKNSVNTSASVESQFTRGVLLIITLL